MHWAIWIIGTVVLSIVGVALMRSGYPRVVRAFLLLSGLLLTASVANMAIPAFAGWLFFAKPLLGMMAASTLVLAVIEVKRDRDEVMGRPLNRDQVASTAVLSGASSVIE